MLTNLKMFAEKDEKYIDYIIWISIVILVNVLSTDSQLENNQGTSICYVTEIYRKTNISYLVIRTLQSRHSSLRIRG